MSIYDSNKYTVRDYDVKGKMTITRIEEFPEVLLFGSTVYTDDRGWFTESYSDKLVEDFFGPPIQHNHSHTKHRGTVRGLHFQNLPHDFGKIVRCTQGAVYDVIVDVRKDSPTRGNWIGVVLSRSNGLQILVPRGFAHGFQALEHSCDVQYIQDGYYNAEAERGINPLDPAVGIEWPYPPEKLSEKDSFAPLLAECDINF